MNFDYISDPFDRWQVWTGLNVRPCRRSKYRNNYPQKKRENHIKKSENRKKNKLARKARRKNR